MMEFKKYKIKDIGDVVGGATPLTKDPSNYDGDISWITPNDLSHHNEVYISTGERNITPKGLKEIGNSLLPKDTVLFSSRAPIGYVAIAAKELCTNQGFKSVIPNTKIVHPEYLYYTLKFYKSHIEKRGAGTTFMEVSGSTMESIELPFPSLDDQIKIADVLLKIDQKISLNTRMNAELEAMAKQLYDYWFVQFDFPDENGKPYKSSGGKMVYNSTLKREIPEGWEDKQMYDVSNIIAGRDCPANYSSQKNSKNNIPIYSNGIENSGLYGYTDIPTAPSNSITVSARGTIGNPFLRLHPFVPIIRLIVATPFDEGADLYIFEYLKVIQIKNTGSVQPQLPVPEFSMIKIPYPKDIIILKKYSDITRKWYKSIEENKKHIEYLAHLRDSLLPVLMNGQVTVE